MNVELIIFQKSVLFSRRFSVLIAFVYRYVLTILLTNLHIILVNFHNIVNFPGAFRFMRLFIGMLYVFQALVFLISMKITFI